MSGLAVLLALASSVTWGIADFGGGLVSRRLSTVAVTVVSQTAGFVVLLIVFGARGAHLDGRSFAIGLAAGAGGGAGLAAFYRALAVGTMSIVSPIVACGAVVPFAISIATGERPSTIALTGAGVALAGAVLASAEERRAAARERAHAVMLATLAAGALGLFTYFLGLGSREGTALSTLVGARRITDAAAHARTGVARAALDSGTKPFCRSPPSASATLRPTRSSLSRAAPRGCSNSLWVLGSLYPVMTVLLAYVFLGERLTTLQLGRRRHRARGVAALSVG